MPEDEWSEVLRELHTNEIEIRDSYYAVFHLMSTARSSDLTYTQENNAARFESSEEAAIAADDAVYNVWASHPRRVVIDNYSSFDDKVKKLIGEILNVIE